MTKQFKYLKIIVILITFFSSVLYAIEVGDIITSRASATYEVHGYPKSTLSNIVVHKLEQSDAEISFLYANAASSQSVVLGTTAYRDENGVLREGSVTQLSNGVVLGDDNRVALEDTGFYGLHDTAIIKVIDLDQNFDRDIRNTLEITIGVDNGDKERLVLLETGVNTGVFIAYIPLTNTANNSYDNLLYVEEGETIVANYENQSTQVKSDSAKIILKKEFKIWLEKEVNKERASVGELLEYTLNIHNEENFEVPDVILTDRLPSGLKYQRDTMYLNGEKIRPIISKDGKELSFKIKNMLANANVEVKLIGAVTAGVKDKKIINEAFVKQGKFFTSNVAYATTQVEEELMRSSGIIIGKIVDKSAKGVAGVRVYLESGKYVVTDIHGKYHFEGVNVGRHIVQVDKELLPNGYSITHNFSQFIDMSMGAIKKANFCLKRVKVDHELSQNSNEFVVPTKVEEMPTYGSKALRDGKRRAILWPPEGYVPFIPSTKIAIKHPKEEQIVVWLNGYRVSQMNYDGVVNYKKLNNSIELYRGVDLLERGNLLKVEFFKNTKLVKTLTRNVHVSSAPVQVEYVKRHSHAIADGKSSPVIAVKFLDDSGLPLRSGITGSFTVEAPYTTQESLDKMQNNPLAKETSSSKYIVHSDGTAYIKLQPTTKSGEVTLHFNLQNRDEVVRAWLKPALREWIMVGFAEGTVGYNKLKGHKESLHDVSQEKEVIKEGRVAFFAKGKIRGDWLLSMAYDSGKERANTQLFDEVNPNKYYTLYGDSTQQYEEAASREKLYVKVEKEQFNLLFGDFNTDMSYTELSEYSRTFTGLKSEYHGENFEAKVFATHTEQLFLKDEIRGDGTSGYYDLSQKNLLEFSEKITIEIRDRYQHGKVLKTSSMQRFRDYEIDYALGRILFNDPVFSNDENFNPRYIVVDYEVEGSSGKHYTYGGRAAVKKDNGELEFGLSYVNENSGLKSTELMGSDVTYKLGKETRIRAEYAETKSVVEQGKTRGSAKLVELEHSANGLYAQAYYREQDDTFGLGQQSKSLGATRKIGVDITQQFDNRQSHKVKFYRESDLLKRSDIDVFEYRGAIENQEWDFFAGYRYSKKSFDVMAQQILVGGSHSFFNQRLKLRATHEQDISKKESDLFPTKTVLGLEYALSDTMDFFTNYEWANSKQGRVGVRVRPWSGMSIENTTVSEMKNDAQNVYNTLGAVQSFQVTKELGVNVGFEQAVAIDKNSSKNMDDFTAYHVALNYNEKSYSVMMSAELREGINKKKVNLSTALYTQSNDSLAMALGGKLNKSKTKESDETDINAHISMAYRPNSANVIMLEKFEYRSSNSMIENKNLKSEKLINNFNINLSPTRNSELALQYGAKYVFDSIDSFEHKGVTQLFGLDASYDLTDSWKFGLQGSCLYAQSANNFDYGFGVYSGHNLFDNMLLTIGYNWKGFEDEDFSLQTYRLEGAYFRFNMKFDQESLKNSLKMMSW